MTMNLLDLSHCRADLEQLLATLAEGHDLDVVSVALLHTGEAIARSIRDDAPGYAEADRLALVSAIADDVATHIHAAALDAYATADRRIEQ